MKETIQTYLKAIEGVFNIRIFYACESGSRMWGFPSPDSDWDVRFLYYRPLEHYVTPFERRDVIEKPDIEKTGLVLPKDLDFAGWDLSKVVYLASKSNPVLFEWLNSHINYVEMSEDAHKELYSLCYKSVRPLGVWYHYFSMMKHNYREHMKEDQVKLKKYLYILRATLSCMRVDNCSHNAKKAPFTSDFVVPNPQLRQLMYDVLYADRKYKKLITGIEGLLELKAKTPELGYGPKISIIHDFLDEQVPLLEKYRQEIDEDLKDFQVAKPNKELTDYLYRVLESKEL